MKPNYVLIDYESVNVETAEALAPAHFKVLLFVGANQPNVKVDVASVLQAKGADATYIKVSASGRNALDFHLVYYLGRLAAAEPDAYFHVITHDKGMDPLMKHMQTVGVRVSRHDSFVGIPVAKIPPSSSDEEKLSSIMVFLVGRGKQRPASAKTLLGSASALFNPRLSDQETQSLLDVLEEQGLFRREGNKVIYSLAD